MRYAILENYEHRAVSVRTSDVQAQLRILANHLIAYRYMQDTSSEVINAELSQLSNLYDGRVLIVNQNLKVVKLLPQAPVCSGFPLLRKYYP